MRTHDAVIIGGGIAGLSCARRLYQAGRDFVLVTDRLGGRMFAGPAPMHNFGAMYVTTDYRHVGRFVDRGQSIRFKDVFFRDGESLLNLWHPRNLRHSRALRRLYVRLIEFRRALNRLRAACPGACQAEIRRREPLLDRAARQPAEEFVAANGLSALNEIFVEPMVNSTVFATFSEVNVFYYLAVLMPILVPTYLADFSPTLDRLAGAFRDRILVDRVVSLERDHRGDFSVATLGGDLRSRNVVVATPLHNVREYCPELVPDGTHGPKEIPMATLHVHGQRRAGWRPGKLVFLRPGEAATVLLPVGKDRDILYTRTSHPDLSPYYESHEVVGRVCWKTAVQLAGASWRCLCPRPGLFTIGDYNICGLEDSYLTGLYAANRIIG